MSSGSCGDGVWEIVRERGVGGGFWGQVWADDVRGFWEVGSRRGFGGSGEGTDDVMCI